MATRLLFPWGAAILAFAAVAWFLRGPSPEMATTITGRVVVHASGVRPDEIRVVAVPRHVGQDNLDAFVARIADPEPHGWCVTTCAADGSFVLGPGVRPDREYRLSVGGRGLGGVREQWVRGGSVGDHVELDAHPILGAAVRFEDEAGRPLNRIGDEWLQAHVGLLSNDGFESPSYATLALNGLRSYAEDDDVLRRYVTNLDPTLGPLVATAGAQPPGRPHVQERVELLPVDGGVEETVVQLPYALDEGPRLSVVFPDTLAEALVGSAERSSLRLHLDLIADWSENGLDGDTDGQPYVSILLERGGTAWTTTAFPVGRYSARLRLMGLDLPLLESEEASRGQGWRAFAPHARDTRFELTADGATLHVPEVEFATVDIAGLDELYGTSRAWVLVQEHAGELGGVLTKHMVRGAPQRFLVHVGKPDARVTRSFLIESHMALLLVDDEGGTVHELGAGEQRTLRAIQCPPGMAPERFVGRTLR